MAQLQCRVTHADGRVLNSRKLLVRAEIGCDLHLYRPAAETIYVPDASDPHLQLHRRQYPLLLDLEDAWARAAACSDKACFLLGLQMGIDLGRINFLREE